MKGIVIYYQENVLDCYTIIFTKKNEDNEYNAVYSSLTGMGFYLHDSLSYRIDKPSYTHLGKKVTFDSLSKELKDLLLNEIELPKQIKKYNAKCEKEGYPEYKIILNSEYKQYVPFEDRKHNPNYNEYDKFVFSHVMSDISFNTFAEIKYSLPKFLL